MINVYAHRGHSNKYPENTDVAFREALALGVQGIELDVRFTSDDHLVVIHDSTVDRVSDGTGPVKSLPFAELKSLDAGAWSDPQFAGQRFLLLEEALALIEDKVELNLHLKTSPENNDKLVEKAVRCIREMELFQTAFIACNQSAIQHAMQIEPRIMGCYLGPRPRNTLKYIEDSLRLDCRILQVPREELNLEFIKLAQEHGMKVNALHVDTKNSRDSNEEVFQHLVQLGIDGVVTDFIEIWLEVQK